jgi:hypothetical protein
VIVSHSAIQVPGRLEEGAGQAICQRESALSRSVVRSVAKGDVISKSFSGLTEKANG